MYHNIEKHLSGMCRESERLIRNCYTQNTTNGKHKFRENGPRTWYGDVHRALNLFTYCYLQCKIKGPDDAIKISEYIANIKEQFDKEYTPKHNVEVAGKILLNLTIHCLVKDLDKYIESIKNEH